jgi:hypothetical protein
MLVLVVVTGGCHLNPRLSASRPGRELELVDSLTLAAPAAGICRDGDRVVVLDAGGDRLLRMSVRLVPQETIPLSRRLVGPRGVKADRFYYYVWDADVVWRMAKEKLVLNSWLGNVRVAGMAGFSPGEMLVSDANRQVVWLKTVFGESRSFLTESELRQPGPVAPLPEGRFCIISGSGQLAYVNRSGVVTGSIRIPEGTDVVESDERGSVYLMESGVPVLWVLVQGTLTAFALPACSSPTGLAVLSSVVVVLDAGTRVLAYARPQP